MQHSVVDYINTLLNSLGIFTERKGITSLVKRVSGETEQTFPAFYIGGGDSKPINWDFNKATLYHRITGEITEEEDDESSSVACDTYVVQTTPMKLVAFFKKDVYKTSNPELKVAQNIKNLLRDTVSSLATTLEVDYVSIEVGQTEINPYTVWDSEYEGVDFKIPSTHCLISIDYEIKIGADQRCFINYGCADEEIDIQEIINNTVCSKVTIYESDGETVHEIINPGGSFTLPEGGGNFMIKSYESDDAAIQVVGQPLQRVFTDFIGYDIDDMAVLVQGIPGVLGHLSTLPANKQFITSWTSATGVMAFRSGVLVADNQITIIGTT